MCGHSRYYNLRREAGSASCIPPPRTSGPAFSYPHLPGRGDARALRRVLPFSSEGLPQVRARPAYVPPGCRRTRSFASYLSPGALPPLAVPALFSEAHRHQELVPAGARPRPLRTLAPRQPHRGVLVLPQPLRVAHGDQGPFERRTRAAQLGVLAHERPESGCPASMRTACSSLGGAATLSEVWFVGLYQYI